MRKYRHLREEQREKLCEMRLQGESMAACARPHARVDDPVLRKKLVVMIQKG
jgi:hypothetical protein